MFNLILLSFQNIEVQKNNVHDEPKGTNISIEGKHMHIHISNTLKPVTTRAF